MRRLSILVSYDGTAYHGWQVQPGLPTIESVIEKALHELEGKPVHIVGSGRTDAGVHALAVCAAFTLASPIPEANLRKALNNLLPHDIRINEVRERHASFHPRYDAIAKTYEYRIWREEICPPFLCRYLHHHPYPLDESAMSVAAARFLGEHDFSAFASADHASKVDRSKLRKIFDSRVWRQEETLIFRIRGSGFLKHMVRNMTGFLLEVGKGNAVPRDLDILLLGGGAKVAHSAPSQGLTQISVEYPVS